MNIFSYTAFFPVFNLADNQKRTLDLEAINLHVSHHEWITLNSQLVGLTYFSKYRLQGVSHIMHTSFGWYKYCLGVYYVNDMTLQVTDDNNVFDC